MPSYSGVWTLTAVYQAVGAGNWTNPPTPIALFASQFSSGTAQAINQILITTTGNATSFGNLSVDKQQASGCGSATRGLWGGGYTDAEVNGIDYHFHFLQ